MLTWLLLYMVVYAYSTRNIFWILFLKFKLDTYLDSWPGKSVAPLNHLFIAVNSTENINNWEEENIIRYNKCHRMLYLFYGCVRWTISWDENDSWAKTGLLAGYCYSKNSHPLLKEKGLASNFLNWFRKEG